MRNHYLNILNLHNSATDKEIKSAFRKLALQYHPDRNPSEVSQLKFIEICKAYEALMNKSDNEKETQNSEKSKFNDIAAQNFIKKYNKELTQEEYEERLKRAEEYNKRKEFKERHIRELSYDEIKKSNFRKIADFSCLLATILFSIITMDYLVLKPIEKEGVLLGTGQNGFHINYLIYDIEGSQNFKKENPLASNTDLYIKMTSSMDNEDWRHVTENIMVKVYQTPIFGDYIGFNESKFEIDKIIFNIHRFHVVFWAYFIVFLLPLITLIFRGPNSFYIIFVYLTSYATFIAAFFFLVSILIFVFNGEVEF